MTRIIEVEQNGSLTLPPDVLGNAQPSTRYVVKTAGAQLIVQPESKHNGTVRNRTLRSGDWEAERLELVEELGRMWPEGVSVTSVFSEMRR
jgi:hypothetical protein